MTDVYSTVLSDEIISQPAADSAQGWVNNLLMQLELDGFSGHGKPVGALDGTGTTSKNSNTQLSDACRYFSAHAEGNVDIFLARQTPDITGKLVYHGIFGYYS